MAPGCFLRMGRKQSELTLIRNLNILKSGNVLLLVITFSRDAPTVIMKIMEAEKNPAQECFPSKT